MRTLATRLASLIPTALATVLILSSSAAQTTTLVSVDSTGNQGNGVSRWPMMSRNDRFIAFESDANNLVPGDTNGRTDVFVRDVVLGTTTRVSVDSTGAELPGDSSRPSISADGRYVAFVCGAPTGTYDVYRHDRESGLTELVSCALGGGVANGPSANPAISDNGRYIAFTSAATNIVSGDSGPSADCFVRDMDAQVTVLASVSSQGVQEIGSADWARPALSGDGRYVAFVSNAANLVPNDTNDWFDLFVHDLQTGTTTLVTPGSQYGSTIDGPAMSQDGRYIAFWTDGPLDPADTNGTADVYLWDMQTASLSRASVDSTGVQLNANSRGPAISTSGRFVAFESDATTLVSGDTNNSVDIFVRDMNTGQVSRVSVDSSGLQANANSQRPSISSDGDVISFQSSASNLAPNDGNGVDDVFRINTTCTGGISSYCTAKTNGLGCVPSIGSLGIPSQSGPDNFYVTASNVRNNKLGMMLWSLAQDSRPFFGGTLCLHSPIKRTFGQMSGGSPTGNDCTGTYAYHFSQTYMLQQLLGAETTVYAQFWTRDPGFPPPNNIGLTNGLQFTICP